MQAHAPFKNEPFRDFSESRHRAAFAIALLEVDEVIRGGGFRAQPTIAGQPLTGSETVIRTDPSNHNVIVGRIEYADIDQAELAVNTARAAFPAWRARAYTERAAILRRMASIMRQRREFLAALMVREVGKPWREADADVAEAIDFCDYYAHQMETMGSARLTEKVLGEENYYVYQPRGVAVVISPWNFPLAITCGMMVAALVTGNAVILKPAEQASLIAAQLERIATEAGIPEGVLSLLPGRGETVGRHLVNHPAVDMIAFTGSRAVGFEILKVAGQVFEGQRSIKKVIAELGGKNAIIIDEDADMDDAVRGVLASTFGYAGQKCSACSRLIVVGAAYEPFLARLKLATQDFIVGPASDPASFMGPVVDSESHTRILNTIATTAAVVPLLIQGELLGNLAQDGCFVPPTIFRDVPLNHPVWTDEIFGPVLACVRVDSFEQALDLANDSHYALTGGVFSRHPAHLAKAREEFRVGNLYINRSITGALVGRQPFGGFRYSGIGSKAGGPDYLLQFVEPRVITENTMRRGFTPELG
jgi:RHH-type proline utilization regulon transcriptional repressor/proline dehydrogenase/delta 1-pyrroline-5-carboxylate dehydrogenase